MAVAWTVHIEGSEKRVESGPAIDNCVQAVIVTKVGGVEPETDGVRVCLCRN
jgi:hypothetical protein